jgi:hypothetical protein
MVTRLITRGAAILVISISDERADQTPELADLCPAWRCHPNAEGRAHSICAP